MSNEFQVHNFYNYTYEELPSVYDEFMRYYEPALHFKEAQFNLKKLSKNEWYKKYDSVEDPMIYELAEEHYKEKK